tara:strand:- start:216 stop:587 length:372 start_codon:yes stop_codon:yes gene_type:complete
MKFLKVSFYLSNIILFIFYLYPGSLFGCIFYNNCSVDLQITKDFIVSSNHFYVFLVFSLLGILCFHKKLKNILYYLFSLSVILELLQIIVPVRTFEFADLLGNILGVLLSLILFKLFLFRRFR